METVKAAVVALPLAVVEPDPCQPRKQFDASALAELAGSLLQFGQLQPIVVRTGASPGRYTIVCGERRWRAARLARLATIDALIMTSSADPSADCLRQLAENAQRCDLAPLDQAHAFANLMRHQNWSARRLARALSVSPMKVARALELLELPAVVQADLAAGLISPRRAREEARPPARKRAPKSTAPRAKSTRSCTHSCSHAQECGATPAALAPVPAPARASASAPAEARVYPTRHGRVIVELDQPGARYAIIESMIEAFQLLRAELGVSCEEREG